MKRSILAVAALLLFLSSATYASTARHERRMERRHAWFWGPVLVWLEMGHHQHEMRMERPCEHARPPQHWDRENRGLGWRWGWWFGRHEGWDRNDQRHPDRHGWQGPRDGGHEHGRGGDRG
ncbi:MAG TPA: hypothetical protein VMH22_11855 [bacterium]|nr:hypothetical protein [bacterium]